MKLRGLLLGSISSALLSAFANMSAHQAFLTTDPVLSGGGGSRVTRSPGGRAHRRWRKQRSAGRAV